MSDKEKRAGFQFLGVDPNMFVYRKLAEYNPIDTVEVSRQPRILHSYLDCERVLRRVNLYNSPMKIKLVAVPLGLEVHLIDIIDRNSFPGEARYTQIVFGFQVQYPCTTHDYFRFVERSVMEVFLHEFAEAFHIDNQRINDPHDGGGSKSFLQSHWDYDAAFNVYRFSAHDFFPHMKAKSR